MCVCVPTCFSGTVRITGGKVPNVPRSILHVPFSDGFPWRIPPMMRRSCNQLGGNVADLSQHGRNIYVDNLGHQPVCSLWLAYKNLFALCRFFCARFLGPVELEPDIVREDQYQILRKRGEGGNKSKSSESRPIATPQFESSSFTRVTRFICRSCF